MFLLNIPLIKFIVDGNFYKKEVFWLPSGKFVNCKALLCHKYGRKSSE